MRRIAFPVILCALIAPIAVADDKDLLRALEDAFVEIGESVSPSVVSIEVISGPNTAMRDLMQQLGMPEDEEAPIHMSPRSSASGIVYDAVGNIVTNNHVIEGARSITVTLTNGDSYDARIVGGDPDTDLAVIKIEPEDALTPARFGDSDSVRIGQFAIAIGSASGLTGSVSFGHITGLGRTDLNIDDNLRFQDFVQTDAAINLGNSGGPLCNIDGEVIGINTAIVPGAASIGFAIPVNMAKRFVPELIARGKVMRGYLGVAIVDLDYGDAIDPTFPTSAELMKSLDMPDSKGAYVQGFTADSPAERAGIREGDVIRSVNGANIINRAELIARIAEMPPGSVAYVQVWRRELGRPGGPVEIRVKLGEYPGSQRLAYLGRPILGMYLRKITDTDREAAGLEKDQPGLMVIETVTGGPAEKKDISAGDIILEVAQEPIADPGKLRELIDENVGPGDSLHLRILTQEGAAEPRVLFVPENE